MKAMILCAGLGTRLRPLTDTLPKPAIPLKGKPLAFWTLDHLLKLGIKSYVINTHYLPEKIKSLFMGRSDIECEFTEEQPKILGSGGGIGNARVHLEGDDHFWVANGDEVFLPKDPATFEKAQKLHRSEKALATLVVIPHPDVGTKFGGVWVNDTQEVLGFGKSAPQKNLTGYHFTGFQIFSDKVFDYIPKGESNIFYDVLNKAISQGEKVQVYVSEGRWFETGNLEDLKLAESQL